MDPTPTMGKKWLNGKKVWNDSFYLSRNGLSYWVEFAGRHGADTLIRGDGLTYGTNSSDPKLFGPRFMLSSTYMWRYLRNSWSYDFPGRKMYSWEGILVSILPVSMEKKRCLNIPWPTLYVTRVEGVGEEASPRWSVGESWRQNWMISWNQ